MNDFPLDYGLKIPHHIEPFSNVLLITKPQTLVIVRDCARLRQLVEQYRGLPKGFIVHGLLRRYALRRSLTPRGVGDLLLRDGGLRNGR